MATTHNPLPKEKYVSDFLKTELLPSSQEAIQEYRSFVWNQGLTVVVAFLGLMTSLSIDTSNGFEGTFTVHQMTLLFVTLCCFTCVVYRGYHQKSREQLIQNLRKARNQERLRFLKVLDQYHVEGTERISIIIHNEEKKKNNTIYYTLMIKFIDSYGFTHHFFHEYFPSFPSINWNKKDEVEKKNEEE